MQRLRMAVMLGTCLLVIGALDLCAEESSKLPTLLQQLQSPETTNKATEQLLHLGKTNPEARRYLATHLPSLINRGPNSQAWGNAVRLVGELKIAEGAPILAKWVSVNTGGTTTFAQEARLEFNPAAKALAQIGDPAVPSLTAVLSHGNLSERQIAVYSLNLIGSQRAKGALRMQLKRESDPGLRAFIEKALGG